MSNTQDVAAIAQALVKGDPLSTKLYPDGRMVVIAPSGQKLHFTTKEVQAVKQALYPQKEVESVPKKVSRTRKTSQKDPTQVG